MKKVLITGENSYIGTSFKKYVKSFGDKYLVETISVRDESWREKDFSNYDVVFHVAGIAHVSTDPKMESIYYKVNRDLTIKVAEKSKLEKVKQFIFMSSIIVYGDSSSINEKRIINRETIPTPSNFYGKSKLQAEEGINKLNSKEFKIVNLRPPMIYGKGSKGNYNKLSKVAKLSPFFPDIDNERSMLHIDNLCEFIRLIIENEEKGIFYPQNKEYVKTSNMVKLISDVNNKKIILTKIFNPLIKVLSNYFGIINKVFGNLVYEKSMGNYKDNYIINSLEESIKSTEEKI